ncbi:hypothetical protein [Candidatus Nitrospira salsa]
MKQKVVFCALEPATRRHSDYTNPEWRPETKIRKALAGKSGTASILHRKAHHFGAEHIYIFSAVRISPTQYLPNDPRQENSGCA